MNIKIPSDAEPLLMRNAALAGFDDLHEYVLSLILQDNKQHETALPNANDPRIVKAIDEGYASGDAGEVTPEFWEQRRRKLEEWIAGQHEPS